MEDNHLGKIFQGNASMFHERRSKQDDDERSNARSRLCLPSFICDHHSRSSSLLISLALTDKFTMMARRKKSPSAMERYTDLFHDNSMSCQHLRSYCRVCPITWPLEDLGRSDVISVTIIRQSDFKGISLPSDTSWRRTRVPLHPRPCPLSDSLPRRLARPEITPLDSHHLDPLGFASLGTRLFLVICDSCSRSSMGHSVGHTYPGHIFAHVVPPMEAKSLEG